MNLASTTLKIFVFSFIIISLFSCGKRKQRDMKKLNWYEITTEARGDEVRILVPSDELEAWKRVFPTKEDSLLLRLNMNVRFEGYSSTAILDSLKSSTTASLVALRGEELKTAMNKYLIFGQFDLLMPAGKAFSANKAASGDYQASEYQGFAIPIMANPSDSLESAYFAIPNEAECKAGTLVLLNEILSR